VKKNHQITKNGQNLLYADGFLMKKRWLPKRINEGVCAYIPVPEFPCIARETLINFCAGTSSKNEEKKMRKN